MASPLNWKSVSVKPSVHQKLDGIQKSLAVHGFSLSYAQIISIAVTRLVGESETISLAEMFSTKNKLGEVNHVKN